MQQLHVGSVACFMHANISLSISRTVIFHWQSTISKLKSRTTSITVLTRNICYLHVPVMQITELYAELYDWTLNNQQSITIYIFYCINVCRRGISRASKLMTCLFSFKPMFISWYRWFRHGVNYLLCDWRIALLFYSYSKTLNVYNFFLIWYTPYVYHFKSF